MRRGNIQFSRTPGQSEPPPLRPSYISISGKTGVSTPPNYISSHVSACNTRRYQFIGGYLIEVELSAVNPRLRP